MSITVFVIFACIYIDIPNNFDELKDLTEAYSILVSKLADTGVAAQYKMFGIQLGVPNAKIEQLEQRNVDVRAYLNRMLIFWRQQGGGDLREILKAIRSPTINNQQLASKLEKRWKSKGYCELHIYYIIVLYHTYFYLIQWELIQRIRTIQNLPSVAMIQQMDSQ